MNNKPVAWIDPYDLERLPLDCWVNGEKSKWADVPLYTHQVKELTDEEILQFQDKVPYTLGSDLIEFARAILRKAQENG
jgi:hypothetical protein